MEWKMLNVLDFGARPNSFQDDTDAFIKAMEVQRETKGTLYVPEGIYYVSKSISLLSCNLKGAGSFATTIINTNPLGEPILYVGRSCVVSDLTISFEQNLLSRHEKQGEFVGVMLRDKDCIYKLQRASTIRNVRILNTGTAIYDERTEQPYRSVMSVTFEAIEIDECTFRGIDFSSKTRTGNYFANIYIKSSMPDVDTLIHLEGEDSEISMHQIDLAGASCHTALRIHDVRGLSASTIHIIDVKLRESGDSFVELDNSVANIDTLTVLYSVICPGASVISLGNAQYDVLENWAKFKPETMGYLGIHNLHIKGLNDPISVYSNLQKRGISEARENSYLFFRRDAGKYGRWRVKVDQYSWYTFQNDSDEYDEMPRETGNGIDYEALGTLMLGGPTACRPNVRLCPFVTRYYDTDIDRSLLWTGNKWSET